MLLSTAANIWQLQARGDIKGIIQALDAIDPQVRARAVMALGALNAAEALPKLKLLREREFNPTRRKLFDQTIAKLEGASRPPTGPLLPKTPPTFDELVQQVRPEHPEEAEKAIQELTKLKDRRAVEPLIMAFRNYAYPAKTRLACAEALLALESAPASVSLLGALRKPQSHIRRNAAAILGQLKADWAVIPLVTVMQNDPSNLVRKTAVAALRHIRTPEALMALQNLPPELKEGPLTEDSSPIF
jgi:HEAT repeat protein